MAKFMVEYVINDDSRILRTFEAKEEALRWAKDNYKSYTRDGGAVYVTSRDGENQAGHEKWRTYKAFW